MLFLIAAFLSGAVPNSPPDDDDAPPGKAAPSHPQPEASDEKDDDEERSQPGSTIIVTARKLDAARTQIDNALGASVYALTNDTIENRPGGETGSVADILSQTPGVSLSSRGLNIRGSAANQVRINNVIIPEAISDPADQLSSRLAETTRLITGTLPAQFGFAPAGVISVTTKNGLYGHGGQAELFAGTNGMIEPAFEWAGSAAETSLFASGDLDRDLSSVTDEQGITAHDRRTDIGGLAFADHLIDENDRVSLILGGSSESREIGRTSIGPGTERRGDGYGVETFQHSDNGFTLQASLFQGLESRRSRFFEPSDERHSSFGTQIDAASKLGTAHMLRFGLLAARSAAHELDPAGDQSSSSRTALALYGQDEWSLGPSLTFNPGVRVEWLRGPGQSGIVEPRASLVWQGASGLAVHAGYARYASAPPLGEEPQGNVLKDERDDVLDAGLQEKLGYLTLGLDGYWRSARNFIAEHENLGSAVTTAFGFERARIRGLELSATYARRSTSAWANLSLSRASARTIVGGEELFSPATISASSMRFVPLASDRPVTFSAGLVQRVGRLSLSGDLVVSSGSVRTLDTAKPNGSRNSPYALLGLAAVYHATIAGEPADLRLDLINLTNVKYAMGDPANLEGGWKQWGNGRAITVGIEQGF
jgi:outer membrane receptor protein involved in Fe transport